MKDYRPAVFAVETLPLPLAQNLYPRNSQPDSQRAAKDSPEHG
jgi:hypothetical protein